MNTQRKPASIKKASISLLLAGITLFAKSPCMNFGLGIKRLLVSTVLISCGAKILSKPVDSFVCSPKELV